MALAQVKALMINVNTDDNLTFFILVGVELFNPSLQRNNLVATLSTMGPQYVLKINLTVNSLPDTDWTNVFQVTIGGWMGTTGDRYPWLGLGTNGILLFKSDKNNKRNQKLLEFTPTLGTKYKIELRQVERSGTTFTEIFIDDTEMYSDVNTAPLTVENAMVYLSNNFRQSADATVEYFYLESY